MLTPRFKLDQDEKFLHVTIYAPFTHIDKTEVFMDEDEFRFFSKPYYLRLHLPGEVIENDEASATWDAETSSFIVKCPKKTPGEAFSGLEMITELLTPKGEKELKNKIEEIEDNFDKNDNCDSIEEELEELDFYFEQSFPEDENESLTKSDGYGFAFQQFGVYKKLLAEFGEILDITDPDGKSQSERNEVSHEKEQQEFNAEHYLSDLFDSVEEINSIISEPCEFSACIIGSDNLSQPININKQSEVLAFSPSEQEAMLALPRSRKIIPPNLLTSVHYSLADILFGYCYIVRVLGNDCPELAWCVSKLSSTLSCVRRHCSARDLMVSSIRRSLCYPLYRNFELAEKVWQDVIIILQIGTPAVLKCLLALIPAFNSSPGYYIFNQLYINDYAVWIQNVPSSHLQSLALALDKTLSKISKDDIGLELSELEEAAHIILKEEHDAEVVKLSSDFSKTSLINHESDDSDDDSDSDSESVSDTSDSDDPN